MYYINDIEKMHKKLMVGELHPFELYKWIVSYERIISLNKKLNKIYPLSSNITEIYNLLNSTFDLDKLPAYTISQIKENIFRPKINDELDKIQGKIDGNRILLKKVANYVENFDLKQDKKTIGCKVEFNERDGYHLITTKKRWLSIEKDIKKSKLEGIKLEELVGKDNSVSGTKIFSEQLKKISDELIRSETDICNKMQEAYVEFSINFCEKYKLDINNIINWVSYVDFIYSGAQCIHKYRYTIPIIKEDSKSWFSCKQIRHPIVERISDIYIPFNIDLGKEYVGITLFGLNSAGKSTLQKSVGLNIILAQIGYPVACVELEYSPYHSLFTRISGNDNLFKGLSSFTVEMLEIRNIL
jgi:DNA mismatch repair protein MutS